MPSCIECRYPVKTLYTSYSKADDRSLGRGVRLTQCPRCKRFADKYVEHDFVVLFIDLVLIKPQVYRHLLFNRLGREDDKFDPSIIRLSILLLLFDVYLTWARIEKATPPAGPQQQCADAGSDSSTCSKHTSSSLTSSSGGASDSPIASQPLVLQYLFFLALVTVQTLAFHAPIRLLCAHPPRIPPRVTKLFRLLTGRSNIRTDSPGTSGGAAANKFWEKSSAVIGSPPLDAGSGFDNNNSGNGSGVSTSTSTSTSSSTSSSMPLFLLPYYPYPTPLSTALLVSSCTKLLPILIIVWEYDLPSAASAVSWAVFVNNVAALEILMDCGYVSAAVLVAVGAAIRGVVGWAILSLVGLEGSTGVEMGEWVRSWARSI